jgi:hypothetical protein
MMFVSIKYISIISHQKFGGLLNYFTHTLARHINRVCSLQNIFRNLYIAATYFLYDAAFFVFPIDTDRSSTLSGHNRITMNNSHITTYNINF